MQRSIELGASVEQVDAGKWELHVGERGALLYSVAVAPFVRLFEVSVAAFADDPRGTASWVQQALSREHERHWMRVIFSWTRAAPPTPR